LSGGGWFLGRASQVLVDAHVELRLVQRPRGHLCRFPALPALPLICPYCDLDLYLYRFGQADGPAKRFHDVAKLRR
jgi:hypothetical protein